MKFCKDCRYAKTSWGDSVTSLIVFWTRWHFARCHHPELQTPSATGPDLVTGAPPPPPEPPYARVMRLSGHRCGSEGRLFAERPEP